MGTVMATLLARAGIDTVLLEAGQTCAEELRASTFHPPTLEMLDQIGITPTLPERGLKAPIYHWRDRQSGESVAFDLSELSDITRYPYRIQCEQYHLSNTLAAVLDETPNADVRFGTRLLSFEQDDTGVTVFAEGVTEVERIRCDWLIGTDGANSLVRKWLGIEFDGFTYPEKFLCLTTKTGLADHMTNLALVSYVSDPQEWLVLLRVPSLWRVLVPTDDTKLDAELLGDAAKNAVFDRLIGNDATAERIARFERRRRTVTHAFTQAQSIQNMEYIKVGNGEAHKRRRADLQAICADDGKRRAYLMRQAMFESLAQAAEIS